MVVEVDPENEMGISGKAGDLTRLKVPMLSGSNWLRRSQFKILLPAYGGQVPAERMSDVPCTPVSVRFRDSVVMSNSGAKHRTGSVPSENAT